MPAHNSLLRQIFISLMATESSLPRYGRDCHGISSRILLGTVGSVKLWPRVAARSYCGAQARGARPYESSERDEEREQDGSHADSGSVVGRNINCLSRKGRFLVGTVSLPV